MIAEYLDLGSPFNVRQPCLNMAWPAELSLALCIDGWLGSQSGIIGNSHDQHQDVSHVLVFSTRLTRWSIAMRDHAESTRSEQALQLSKSLHPRSQDRKHEKH